MRTIIPHNIEGESNDAPKQFTNIDSEDFVITWEQPNNTIKYTVKAGETVTYPKYLANFASYHLARKMVKREMRKEYAEKHPTEDIQRARFSTRNEDREVKLQKDMLSANPEVVIQTEPEVKEPPIERPKEPELPRKPEPEKQPETKTEGVKCPHCEFVAKSEFGLKAHIRGKHKNK